MAELGLEFETSDSSLVLCQCFLNLLAYFSKSQGREAYFRNLLFNSPLNIRFHPKISRMQCLSRKDCKLCESREFLPVLFTHVLTV